MTTALKFEWDTNKNISNIEKHGIDFSDLTKFTMKKQGKTNWDKLNKMSDSQINYSEIPETNMDFWSDAEIIYPQKKTKLTITLDEDLVLWLKQFGDKYNNTINNILRVHFSTFRYLSKSKHNTP
ncbi:MAG: BrnA antitoxin family protein [Bacteroidetes bacterium]|nr:BrnA antitoxin family protein [Bacteroidota bacterium]